MIDWHLVRSSKLVYVSDLTATFLLFLRHRSTSNITKAPTTNAPATALVLSPNFASIKSFSNKPITAAGKKAQIKLIANLRPLGFLPTQPKAICRIVFQYSIMTAAIAPACMTMTYA